MFLTRIISLINKGNVCSWTVWISLCTIYISTSFGQERVLCYYANWSEKRNTSYRLYPWNIDISLCTHVVYAFAMPDLSEGVVPLDFLNTLNDNQNNEFVNLKRSKPDLTLMLSIGGWQEGSKAFSQISADPSATRWISEILIQKIRNVGFDGLDINWQWPVPGLREGSNSADKENFARLVRTMRRYISLDAARTMKPPLLLSVVLPPFESYAERGFDLETILGMVDFVNIHSMDYHDSTSAEVNHLAPLFSPSQSSLPEPTIDSTVKMYLERGINSSKINLGIPFYGFSFELQDENLHDLKSPAEEEGDPGFGINTPGMLAYFEICKYIIDEKWIVNWPNRTAVGPYAYHNKRWVGFDDPEIIRRKVQYAVDNQLGGIFLMTIDMDDFNGICRERFPLTKAAANMLKIAKRTTKLSPIPPLENLPQPSRQIDKSIGPPPSQNVIPDRGQITPYEKRPSLVQYGPSGIESSQVPPVVQLNGNGINANPQLELLLNPSQSEADTPIRNFNPNANTNKYENTQTQASIPAITRTTTFPTPSYNQWNSQNQNRPFYPPPYQQGISLNNYLNTLHYYKTNGSYTQRKTNMTYNRNKLYTDKELNLF